MNRSLLRTLSAATLTGSVALVAASGASAKLVDRGHFHGEFFEVVDGFCGMEGLVVEIASVVDIDYRVQQRGGHLYFHEHLDTTDTLTNTADGQTLVHAGRNLAKDIHVTDNGDGTLTVIQMSVGNVTTLDEDGKAIARDPGQLRKRLVFGDAGTPEDPDDDVLLSSEVLKGSTGRNDDFCAAVADQWG